MPETPISDDGRIAFSALIPRPQSVSFHAPYEDAIIAGFELLGKVIDGQDAATKKELWTRYLDATKPWHELSLKLGDRLIEPLTKLIAGGDKP